MDYIDLQGKKVSNITNQDKLLSFLYTNIFGRMLLKPLIQPQVSKLAGRYLSSAHSKWLISKFIERNEINMDIYEECDYSSFNDFFTRKIKPDCRPVPEDLDVLISPCDCLATVYPIQENTTFSIKNAIGLMDDATPSTSRAIAINTLCPGNSRKIITSTELTTR